MVPLQPWGLEEAHNHPPSGAPHAPTTCTPGLDELLGKLEEVLTLFLFRSSVLVVIFLSGRQLGSISSELKVAVGTSRTREVCVGRGGGCSAGCSAGAKGSVEALFREPGGRVREAREVQKTEIGSFWKGVWFSSPASTGEGGEGSAVPFARSHSCPLKGYRPDLRMASHEIGVHFVD